MNVSYSESKLDNMLQRIMGRLYTGMMALFCFYFVLFLF